jgi:hypothetical protein
MRAMFLIALSGAFNRFTVSSHTALIDFTTRSSIWFFGSHASIFLPRNTDNHLAEPYLAQSLIFAQKLLLKLAESR